MPYNSETETFYQAPATVVDSTPDGDTVQEGFDDRLTPAMAGLYADLNLLKADGMISVGIPATTTARGIGRVATSADLVDGATINNGPAFFAAGVHTSVAAVAGKVPVADSGGKLDAWISQQTQYASCATASATAAKVADLANFQLVKGSRVFVIFSNANTIAGALTLNVNSTGAKPIYDESGRPVSATNLAYFPAGCKIEFVYDGTNWVYVRRCVASWTDGSSWYRLYTDGFKEQGGYLGYTTTENFTVTLPTPFLNASYVINIYALPLDWASSHTAITSRSSSSFSFTKSVTASDVNWYAAGY